MKKISDTYKEQGIAFTFPIEIKDSEGNQTYFENSNGYWWKHEYDADNNETYYETKKGYWFKKEYDAKGNETYYEDSKGYWRKREYDAKGNETYFEDSKALAVLDSKGSQSYAGKVIEVDGKKYKLMEL